MIHWNQPVSPVLNWFQYLWGLLCEHACNVHIWSYAQQNGIVRKTIHKSNALGFTAKTAIQLQLLHRNVTLPTRSNPPPNEPPSLLVLDTHVAYLCLTPSCQFHLNLPADTNVQRGSYLVLDFVIDRRPKRQKLFALVRVNNHGPVMVRGDGTVLLDERLDAFRAQTRSPPNTHSFQVAVAIQSNQPVRLEVLEESTLPCLYLRRWGWSSNPPNRLLPVLSASSTQPVSIKTPFPIPKRTNTVASLPRWTEEVPKLTRKVYRYLLPPPDGAGRIVETERLKEYLRYLAPLLLVFPVEYLPDTFEFDATSHNPCVRFAASVTAAEQDELYALARSRTWHPSYLSKDILQRFYRVGKESCPQAPGQWVVLPITRSLLLFELVLSCSFEPNIVEESLVNGMMFLKRTTSWSRKHPNRLSWSPRASMLDAGRATAC